MHPVSPPTDLQISNTLRTLVLSWRPSREPAVQGYHGYHAALSGGPFIRLTGAAPHASTTFQDSPPPGRYTYMVRAAKFETTPSGTYLNASQSTFGTTVMPGDPSGGALAVAVTAWDSAGVQLLVNGPAGQGFTVQISPDLHRWTTVSSNQVTSGTVVALPAPIAPTLSARFYLAKGMN